MSSDDENAHRFKTIREGLFEIELGYETVRLSKVFGPLIFQDIQIRADPATCEWVIERAVQVYIDDNYERTDWIEVHRIEGQLPGEFHDG